MIRKETRKVNAMDTRATVVPDSVNVETRSVDIVWGTETPVRRYSWNDGPWLEVLSFDKAHVRMERFDNGVVPLLDNHNSWNGTSGVLGSVSGATLEKGQGRATITFADTPDVENTWIKVRDGHIKGVSVGYRVHQLEKLPSKNPNEPDKVPTYRAVDWEPMEVSIAPVPADHNSGIRSSEDDYNSVIIINNNTEDTMKREEIIALLHKRGISVDSNATDTELLGQLERAMTPTPTPAPIPAPAPVADVVNAEEVRAAERKRSNEIRLICRQASIDEATTQKYIDDNATVEAVRTAALEKFVANDPSQGAGSNSRAAVGEEREVEARRTAMSEALVLRSGAISGFKPTIDMAMVQEYRAMKLVDMAKTALSILNVDTRGMDDMEVVKRAITSSSSDFPVILEGTNRRILLAAYESIADTWRQFCSVGSVSDFREYKRVKMGSMFSRLDQVNENGEYKNKAITDGTQESISVDTFGNIINVTRKMIVNDDLSAFTRLAANLGRAAARSIEMDVYARLAENSGAGPNMADGNPLFHSSHNNISTAAALSMDALEADRVKMALQKDIDGNDYLDLRPSVLVLPIGLGANARVYNDAAYDPDVTGKFQKPNTVRGLFNTIVDTPRLSGTRRYLFADPSVAPVLEVAFLNGVQTPFMETEEAFNSDGMKWKIRHDYGVAAIDWQGAITNEGA